MTRKDYELIAKVLHDLQQAHYATWNSTLGLAPSYDKEGNDTTSVAYSQLRATELVVTHLAEAFTADNPKFQPNIFYKACSNFIKD